MIEELASASKLLYVALDRYASACSGIQKGYVQANQLNDVVQVQQLFDCITSELPLIASYEKLLKQAVATISLVRNLHTQIVPINSLPDEMLARIFHLTLGSQPCVTQNGGSGKFLFPKCPDLLSHVCSRWRQIAISLPTLWSHIDLAPCHPSHWNLLARARVYANRSGQLPLYIHVLSLEYLVPYSDDDCNALKEFLKYVRNRILSLEVVAGDISMTDDELADINILDTCLRCCRPEVLTQLIIANNANESLYFIHANDFDEDPDIHDALILGLPHGFLESLWGHVTVLQLYGFYPYWTSKAYHNLVELHLTRGGRDIPISEPQLVEILRSSPELKFLRFDLSIADVLPNDASIEPVHLDDLEVLNLIALNSDQLGNFLRWLAPGSLPLKLSVTGTEDAEAFLADNEIRKFFSRSNIIKFCLVETVVTYFQLSNLIGLLPHLRVLAFGNLLASFQPALYPGEYNTSATQTCLDKLYFSCCVHDLDGLQWLLERSQVRTLKLWECAFTQDRGVPNLYVDQKMAHDALKRLIPATEVVTDDKPNPIDDWD